jgi:hypothetical protein
MEKLSFLNTAKEIHSIVILQVVETEMEDKWVVQWVQTGAKGATRCEHWLPNFTEVTELVTKLVTIQTPKTNFFDE